MQRVFTKTFSFLIALSIIFSLNSVDLWSNEGSESNQDLADAGPFLYSATLVPDASPQENEEEGTILGKATIRIINLGPIVNWEGVDYAPTVSADGRTLYYVSNRPGSKLTEDDEPSHDFWAARKEHRLDTVFFQPYNIDTLPHPNLKGVNTRLHEGAASIAADRQSLYFTGCNRPDGLGDCDIYKTTIQGDQWGEPVNLGRSVNSKVFDSQPSIAPDQSRVYFVSTREGPNSDGSPSLENFDIWYSDWDPDLEEWGEAKNLEAINTKGQEASPFIAADNTTLFFASNGHEPTLGGLDFFVTRYDPVTKEWSKPQNLGAPINTAEDEYFITLPASGDIIYFSSARTDLPGYQGNLDIFMAFVPTFFRTVLVKGTIVDECSGEFIPGAITVRNPITGKVFDDTLTTNHPEFEMIVANQDYGNPRDSITAVTLEITASNEKYGKKMKALRVEKPKKTENIEETEKPFTEHFVKITLGQKPVLATDIAEADYISRVKEIKPELASFRGLLMEEVLTWDLYPLLNYVFFDQGESDIPGRYILFDDPSQTEYFTDTTIAGGTLDKYYHLLNIVGYRMKKYPDSKIELVGCNDDRTEPEKKEGLSKNRAQNVYDYLKNIWQIDESRMKLSYRDMPKHPSNPKDTLGREENRRVEILTDEWEILKPVFEKDATRFPQPETMKYIMKNGIEDAIVTKRRIEIKHRGEMWNVLQDVGIVDKEKQWDWKNSSMQYVERADEDPFTAQLIVTTSSGAECASDPIEIPVMQVLREERTIAGTQDSTLERYSLILFPFDSDNAGPRNDRIMRDYVYDRVLDESVVEVIGHTDVVGLFDHNMRLSQRRANTVYNGIHRRTRGNYAEMIKRGVGEEDPLYTNDLPEGRFYNRTVQVIIRTPVEAWEAKEAEEVSEP